MAYGSAHSYGNELIAASRVRGMEFRHGKGGRSYDGCDGVWESPLNKDD